MSEMPKPTASDDVTGTPAFFRIVFSFAIVAYTLFFLAWMVLTGLLLLSFAPADAPWAYGTMAAYPLVFFGIASRALTLYKARRYHTLLFLFSLPLINIVLILISLSGIWP